MATISGVLKRLRERSSDLWRQWDDFAFSNKTILAVSTNPSFQMSLRVLSLEQGWRILFANCLEDGLRLQRMNRVWILVYDRDLPGVEWRRGLRTLLRSDNLSFPIVVSDVSSVQLRSEVLRCGGYDVARNPLEPKYFAALVNGAFALARSIDSSTF
jgi:DNA-binding response OmpR family regulator